MRHCVCVCVLPSRKALLVVTSAQQGSAFNGRVCSCPTPATVRAGHASWSWAYGCLCRQSFDPSNAVATAACRCGADTPNHRSWMHCVKCPSPICYNQLKACGNAYVTATSAAKSEGSSASRPTDPAALSPVPCMALLHDCRWCLL